MLNKKFVSCLVWFVGVSYFASPSNAFAFNDDDRKSIEALVANYTDLWNKHDMEAFTQLFTEDSEIFTSLGM